MDESLPMPAWAAYWIYTVFAYVGVMAALAMINFHLHADRKVLAEVRKQTTIFNRQWVIYQAAEQIYSPRGYKVFLVLKGMMYGLFFLVFGPLLYVQLTSGS